MLGALGTSEVYVVGGRQRRSAAPSEAAHWQYYDRALILALDCATGAVRECVSYESPPAVRAEGEPSVLFKSATLHGDRLYACTTTELITYGLPSFRRLGYVSLPCLNDVHHVHPLENGNLVVANTGLDMVLEVTPEGALVREWNVASEPTWTRFSRDTDYRRVASTKPHEVHPNFVFELNGELWVTCCHQSEAACLTAPGKLPVGNKDIHDGRVVGESVWFTQVNGRLIEVDSVSRQVRRDIDLRAFVEQEAELGWCRGLEVIDPSFMLVGFSRLRPTKWRQAVGWVKQGLGGEAHGLLPTRVAAVSLDHERVVWERDLEPWGMSAIFSVHAPSPEVVRTALMGTIGW